jgi:hypothetical protein
LGERKKSTSKDNDMEAKLENKKIRFKSDVDSRVVLGK